jgi:hypothetical protein
MWNEDLERVRITMTPITSQAEVMKWRFSNTALGGTRDLGVLTLTQEESEYFSGLTSRSDPANAYQSWITSRITNPTNYQINGRLLSSMPIKEQLEMLNLYWNSQTRVDPIR